MSNAIVVRYRTKPEATADNEALVRAVYEELAATKPDGFHYMTFKLDDGVSFVHVAVHDEGADNPLGASPAFGRFQADLASRLDEGPIPAPAQVVGSYAFP
jgi:hypothetical protein